MLVRGWWVRVGTLPRDTRSLVLGSSAFLEQGGGVVYKVRRPRGLGSGSWRGLLGLVHKRVHVRVHIQGAAGV